MPLPGCPASSRSGFPSPPGDPSLVRRGGNEMGVLDDIVREKRAEIAESRARSSLGELRAACRDLPPAVDFAAALRPGPTAGVNLIAEVKRASPSRGILSADLDPISQSRRYAAAGASAISVLTDQKYFYGSLDDLAAVRTAVGLPVLRKEFILDEYQLWQSRAAGADAVLLIAAALDPRALEDLLRAAKGIGLGTLVEVHTADELEGVLPLGAPVIGVNNRDLQTLQTSLDPSLRLLPRIPPGAVAVSESGISSAEDVERVVAAGAHAILVGEALVRAPDVEAKVRELLLAGRV